MKQELIILSAKTYDMPIEGSQERRQGTSVWYVYGLDQCCTETGKNYGYQPIKESLPIDSISKIVAAGGCPCIVEADMIMRSVGTNMTMKIHDFEVKGPVKIK